MTSSLELLSPVSAAMMNTYFDRACHLKQYFSHPAWWLASVERKAHIEEAAVTLNITICISDRSEM